MIQYILQIHLSSFANKPSTLQTKVRVRRLPRFLRPRAGAAAVDGPVTGMGLSYCPVRPNKGIPRLTEIVSEFMSERTSIEQTGPSNAKCRQVRPDSTPFPRLALVP